MKQFVNLLFELENGIAVIRFNRPKVLNALNIDVLKELSELLDLIRVDEESGWLS